MALADRKKKKTKLRKKSGKKPKQDFGAEIEIKTRSESGEDGPSRRFHSSPLQLPSEGPTSETEVNLRFRISRNYQSVELSARVKVPCAPGDESNGLDYAMTKADEFLEKHKADVDELVDALAE